MLAIAADLNEHPGMGIHFIPRLCVFCGLTLSGLGCASDYGPVAMQASAPAATPSAALWADIKAEVGDAACDGPAQCHSLAVGAKACGGPEAYVAWSSKRSDGKRLQALAGQHAAARKDENARSGMVSNCMAVPAPGASCQASRCTLLPRGIAPPPGRAD